MLYHGIPDPERLEEWTALRIPFEYNDFMYPKILDEKEDVQRRIRRYLEPQRDRSADTLHGPFLDIAVHSDDSLIRRVSDYRIRQACEIAETLRVRAVILHTNFIPNFYISSYRQGWVDKNETYLRGLLRDYPRLWIYVENMFDEEPDCLVRLAERMQGERFGICLDFAHAYISRTSVTQWQEACAPYIAHYHLNDNHGKTDEHLPVGDGTLPWEKVISLLNRDASVLLEVDSLEKYEKSAAFLRKQSHKGAGMQMQRG